MTDGPAELEVKNCMRCGATIPSVATMCASCGTSQVDSPPPAGATRSWGAPQQGSVTSLLIWANVLYFAWTIYLSHQYRPGGNLLRYAFGPDGAALRNAGWYSHSAVFERGEWWRVLTACFLHGGLIHIGFNMMALHQLGRITEELLGGARYLACYLICGACSTLAITVWFVHVQKAPAPPMVGASGAIFGIAGILVVFLRRHGTERGRHISRLLVQNLLFMLALGWFFTFISNTGHVGGLVPGLIFGAFLGTSFRDRLRRHGDLPWRVLAGVCVAITLFALYQGVRSSAL